MVIFYLPALKKISYSLLIAFLFILILPKGLTAQQVFNASGTFTVPAGVTTIKVEAWGGGAGGSTGYGGGGGGAFAGSNALTVTSGSTYTVTVGNGGAALNNGQNSSFGNLIVADGGGNGTAGNLGGTVANSTGAIRFAGGNGVNGTGRGGGGGGGSAGAGGAGGNGTSSGNDNPGSGGAAGLAGSGTAGASGGNGGSRNTGGVSGNTPGGGGGENGSSGAGSAAGGKGRVIVSIPTTTSLSINPSSLVYGSTSLTLTATVSPNPGGGTVQFTIDGSINAGTASVNAGSGIATINYNPSTLNAGTHSVVAIFSGSTPFTTSTATAVNFTVTPKPITITSIVANNKVYDGNSGATFTGATSSGIINGDVITYTVAGTFADKNAGVGKTVTISGVTLGGAGAGNYSVGIYPASVTANITPKVLTAASTISSKIYDGSPVTGTLNLGAISGYVGSETLVITPSATNFTNANVGAGKATTISYILANGTNGGLASNYTMANLATTGAITARPLTITAVTNTKTYDATTSAAAIPTITSGALQGSDVANFTETYNNKNVGTGKIITASGNVSDGNGGLNYSYTFVTNNTGVINTYPITVTAVTNTKTYNGNTAAAGIPTITSGSLQGGDLASFTETYDNRNAGTGKILTPAGIVNDGNGGNNYAVTFVNNNTGVINAYLLTVTAQTNTKAYDGNTSAAAIPVISSGSLIAGDVAGFIETYDTKDAGIGKTMTASGTVNDGNAGNNYAITFVTNSTGVINPLVLTYTATAASRAYNTVNPGLSGTITGFIAGENQANATTGTLSFTTTAITTSPVGSYPITGSGLTANNSNYTFAQAAANATAFTITGVPLSINANSQEKCAGTVFNFAGTEFSAVGLVNGDAVSSVTLTSAGSPSGAAPGTYPIVASVAVGSGLGNYFITYNSGSLIVNARPTATITSANTSICNPSTTNITGNVTAIGAWTVTITGGLTATGTGNGTFSIPVSPVSSTTYSITGLVDSKCTATAGDLSGSTIVTISQPIAIITQPIPLQKVCSGTSTAISFTVAATGDGRSYQWYKDDLTNPVGTNSPTYSIPNPVGTDLGIYFVVVSGTSPCSSVQSSNATLIVNQPITISQITPLTQTICEGEQASFTVTASGTGLSYFWRKGSVALSNGGNISGANTTTLIINPATAADAGNDYNILINGDDMVCAQAISSPLATLVVNKKSGNPTSASASIANICQGSSTILTLNGGGGGTGEVIKWYTGSCGGTLIGTGNNFSVSPTITTTYYGRYENGSPCNYTSTCATVQVTVDPTTIAGTASIVNSSVCNGSAPGDITLTGNTGAIQWQKSANAGFSPATDIVGAVGNTLTSAQVGALTAPTYIRAVVKSGVCSITYSNTIYITINALPTVASVTSGNSCGSTVTISATASAGATIDWYNTATGGSPIASGLSFSPSPFTATTTYYAEARNITTGCISVVRTAVVATYRPKPDALFTPMGTQTVCSETAITNISITNPNNTSGTSYTFASNNANVTGISSISAGNIISGTVTNTQNTQQTITYTITPVANGCAGTPVTVSINVNPKPTVAITSAPNAVCYNTAIAINFNNPNTVSGTTFSWTRNNPAGVQAGPVTSGTGNINQTLVNTTASNITVTYTLKATSPQGCFSEVTKDVVLYPEFKGENLTIASSQVLCYGSSASPFNTTINVTGGSGTYNYQWQRSTNLNGPWTNVGPNSDSYTTPSSDAYFYQLIVTDAAGCGSFTSNIVSITKAFDFDFGVSGAFVPSNPGPLCNGSSFTYKVESASLLGLFAVPIRFSWSADNNFINSSTINPYGTTLISGWWIFTYTTFEGIATFTVTNNTNATVIKNLAITPSSSVCSLSPEIVPITIRPVPTMTVTKSSVPLCSGISLNAILKGNITDAATSFTWTSSVTSGTVTGNTTNTTNPISVAAGDTYTLNDNLINNGTVAGTVKYIVIPYSNGCAGTPVEFTITVNPKISAGTISAPASICSGTVPAFSQTAATASSSITYQWQSNTTGCGGTFTNIGGATSASYTPATGLTTTTYYRRTASTTIGGVTCSAITPCISIVVNPIIPVSVSIAATTAITNCAGEAMSFTATPTNGGTPPAYQWQVNGIAVPGQTSSTFSSTTLNNNDKVRVVLTSNVTPCATGTPATSNEIQVTVNPLLPVSVSITATTPTTICAGESVTFTSNTTNPGTNPAYQWYVNGVIVSGANSSGFSPTNLVNGDKVTVKVNSNATPCIRDNPATSNEISVVVNPLLTASVNVSATTSSTICVGGSVSFEATPTNGGNAPVYQWKVNGNNVGTNSYQFSSSTLSNGDVVTCQLTSNATPCLRNSPTLSNAVNIIVTPNAIAGTINNTTPTNLCVGGSDYTYINLGSNGTGVWSNADNNGVFSVDASGKVHPLAAGTAHLRYTVTNSCGSDYTEILLTVGAKPAQPGLITGATQVCSGTSSITYSVPNVAGLTYNWSVPAGWVISGQGTNQITVISGLTLGGIVSVNATTSTYACGSSTSRNLAINVTTAGTWLGYTSNWNDAANWCGGIIPTATTNVTIPVLGGSYVYPSSSTGIAKVNNLTIANNASVTINNYTMQVSGTIASNAAIDANNGTVEFVGSTPQTVSGSYFTGNNLKSLLVSNNLTAEGTNLNILENISFENSTSASLDAGGSITLISTDLKTASVGKLESTNSVTGNLTIERYLKSYRSWRFLAASIKPATSPSFKNSWGEADVYTPGKGTRITGPATGGYFTTPNISPGYSVKSYNSANDTYNFVTDPNSKIANKEGYMVFVRGDLSATPLNTLATATTLRLKGEINTGDQIFTAGPEKLLSIGNPYPSAISAAAVIGAGGAQINTNYIAWDPSLLGTYQVGGFQTISDILTPGIYKAQPGGTALYPTGAEFSNIQSGQAFFLTNVSPTPVTITITESMKTSGSTGALSRTNTVADREYIYTNLFTNSNIMADGNLVVFDDEFSNNIDRDDAKKMMNTGENFGLQRLGQNFVIEARNRISDRDTIFYKMSNIKQTAYKLALIPGNFQNPGMLSATFIDKFLSTETLVDLAGDTTWINFNGTSAAASRAADRFMLVFKAAAGPLPVTITGISANRNNDRSIAIRWTVENEMNIEKYEVERSADGRNFTGIISAAATNSSVYTKNDLSPLAADNFYRIKALTVGGYTQYSLIVKVAPLLELAAITVFPNPVVDQRTQIKFVNQPAGTYEIKLYNQSGQLMQKENVKVSGSNFVKTFVLNNNFAGGVYQLNILNPDGSNTVQQLIIK